MKSEAITVVVRLSGKVESKVKAHADVTIPLGDDGTITILGFCVLDSDSRPPRVMPPGRKGSTTWFRTVDLTGKVRIVVEEAVLSEYGRQIKNSKK